MFFPFKKKQFLRLSLLPSLFSICCVFLQIIPFDGCFSFFGQLIYLDNLCQLTSQRKLANLSIMQHKYATHISQSDMKYNNMKCKSGIGDNREKTTKVVVGVNANTPAIHHLRKQKKKFFSLLPKVFFVLFSLILLQNIARC